MIEIHKHLLHALTLKAPFRFIPEFGCDDDDEFYNLGF